MDGASSWTFFGTKLAVVLTMAVAAFLFINSPPQPPQPRPAELDPGVYIAEGKYEKLPQSAPDGLDFYVVYFPFEKGHYDFAAQLMLYVAVQDNKDTYVAPVSVWQNKDPDRRDYGHYVLLERRYKCFLEQPDGNPEAAPGETRNRPDDDQPAQPNPFVRLPGLSAETD